MKKRMWIFSIFLSFVLILSSCNFKDSKNISKDSSDSQITNEVLEKDTSKEKTTNTDDSLEKDSEDGKALDNNSEKGLINEAIEKEEGKPYEVGVTPDDYNMDYDTSRLLSLEEKKSKYYPKDGVKGLYLNTTAITNPEIYNRLINLIETTKLNAVVVDVKDDWGNITMNFDTDDEDVLHSKSDSVDYKNMLKDFHDRGIYVIGRITTFKDGVITEKYPEWGFTLKDGSLWKNNRGEAFMNPFLKEVCDYDLKIAKLAAKAGFDEIQFDYVRFAEGFETFSDTLDYSRGEYEDAKDMTEGEKRVAAITGFVKRAREELQKYNVPISVDVFGYALQVRRAEGIGQDFDEISNQTDVISSMIYPSHWGSWSFDIEKPDLEPYNLVYRYLEEEQKVLKELEHPPISRPWLQDFTATWIGEGNWMQYDAKAVQDEVDALYDQGQNEFLLWNAAGDYSEGAEY